MDFRKVGNALSQLGHSTARIIDPEARKDNCKRKILSWMGLVLDRSLVTALVRKARDTGSSPGLKFSLS